MDRRLEIIAWVNYVGWLIACVARLFDLSYLLEVLSCGIAIVTICLNLVNLFKLKQEEDSAVKKSYRKRILYQLFVGLGLLVISIIGGFELWKID